MSSLSAASLSHCSTYLLGACDWPYLDPHSGAGLFPVAVPPTLANMALIALFTQGEVRHG